MSERMTREELMGLPHKELRARYEAAYGEVPRTPNKTWIINRILEAPPPRPAARAVAAIREGRKARQTVAAPGPREMPRQAATEAAPPESARPAARSAATTSPSIRRVGEGAYEMDAAAFERRGDEADERGDIEEEGDEIEEGDREVGEGAGDVAGSDEAAEGEEDEDEVPTPPLPREPASVPTERPPRRAPPAPNPPAAAGGPSIHRRGRFRGMTIDELRTLYVQTVGRETSSTDKGYLIWKVREAEMGRIPIGPVVPGQRREGGITQTTKTLPLSLPPESIVTLDDAWVRTGFRSRMSFLRTAIREALERRGERAAATHFPNEDPAAVAT